MWPLLLLQIVFLFNGIIFLFPLFLVVGDRERERGKFPISGSAVCLLHVFGGNASRAGRLSWAGMGHHCLFLACVVAMHEVTLGCPFW